MLYGLSGAKACAGPTVLHPIPEPASTGNVVPGGTGYGWKRVVRGQVTDGKGVTDVVTGG